MPWDTPPLRPKKPCAMPGRARLSARRTSISKLIRHRPGARCFARDPGDPIFDFLCRHHLGVPVLSQVLPIWVVGPDEIDLPHARPLFYALFPMNHAGRLAMLLEVHEGLHAVFLCEALHQS